MAARILFLCMLIISVALVFAGGLAVTSESRTSNSYYLFTNIVLRSMAIQGREMNSLGSTEEGRLLSGQVRDDVREVVDRYDAGDTWCALPIDLAELGVESTLDVFPVLLRNWPLRFAVFFAGAPPDIGPFFDRSRNAPLLEPMLNEGVTDAYLARIFSVDLTGSLRSLDSIGFGTSLGWRSEQCEKFSVIQIEYGF